MAFITANKNELARDLWPNKVAIMGQECELTKESLPSSRVVPDDSEDLTEWLWVDMQPELSRALVYIRSDVDGEEDVLSGADKNVSAPSSAEPVELVLRLQGIISDMNLNVGGDWDGTEPNTVKATQHVTLVSGGYTAAFEPQARALSAIREVVLAMLGRCGDSHPTRTGSITLRKRVFTKIRAGVNDDEVSVIKRAEDPMGKFHAIARSWRVTERIVAGTHLPHGEVFVVPPLSLRRGDFVDVSVCVCIALLRGTSGRRFEVSFEPRIVVRMASPMQWMAITSPTHTLPAPATVDLPKKKLSRRPMASGFKFTTDVSITGENTEDIMEA